MQVLSDYLVISVRTSRLMGLTGVDQRAPAWRTFLVSFESTAAGYLKRRSSIDGGNYE